MAYQPFYIQAFTTGLEKDKADFQLFPDAFSVLQDAYVWRDRVTRKKGYRKVGRLLRTFTDEALNLTKGGTYAIDIMTFFALETNAEIEQGSVEITVDAGNPTQEIFTEPDPADGVLVGDGGGTGTINYVTGEITLVGGAGWGAGAAVAITFNYFPALPCMGIHQLELRGINAEQTIAFDTTYVYHWSTANERFEELNPGNTQEFTGGDSDFFWAVNVPTAVDNGLVTPRSVFVVSNFYQAGDQMYLYDSEALAPVRWQQFSPRISDNGITVTYLEQALLIANFKGRVLAFNTWEGETLATSVNHQNRVRWCRNGDFLDNIDMTLTDVWRHDIQGHGGYIDAATSEAIISIEFVRDTIIVGFEKSTWKIRYTANEILPFVWERIDSEYGVESTYSTVVMDKGQFAIGQKGITACDGINVQRIDTKIPDEVFRIHNANDGVKRVHGIRDFDKELVYWTYPDADLNRKFPNQIFVYNLENQAWSFFKDSITVFGVLQEFNDKTWADYDSTTWEQAEFAWVDTSLQSLYPDTIGGNQHGYIVEMQRLSRNDPGLAITDITTGANTNLEIPDHNLSTDDYIRVVGIIGGGDTMNNTSYRVNYIDDDNITLTDIENQPIATTGVYGGGGEIVLLHDYRIRTKKFNFLEGGTSIEVGYIDFLLDQTTNGQFNVAMYADHNDTVPMNTNDSFFNTTVLTEPYEGELGGQSKLLHRFYSRMHVQLLQFELSLSPTQKLDPQIHDSDITIYAMTLWVSQAGRLT